MNLGGHKSAHNRSIQGEVAKGLQEHRPTSLNGHCLLHTLPTLCLGGHLLPAWVGRAETVGDPTALDTNFSPHHRSFLLPWGALSTWIIYIPWSWLAVELQLCLLKYQHACQVPEGSCGLGLFPGRAPWSVPTRGTALLILSTTGFCWVLGPHTGELHLSAGSHHPWAHGSICGWASFCF